MSNYAASFHRRPNGKLLVIVKKKAGKCVKYRLGESVMGKPIKESSKGIKDQYDYEPGPGEEIICKHFGCGKTLSLQEQRFGNRCVNHPIKRY